MLKKKCQDGDVMEQQYFPKNAEVKSQIFTKQQILMDGDAQFAILISVRNAYSSPKIKKKVIKLQVEIWRNIKMV